MSYWNPSSCCIVSTILGKGYGFLIIFWLNFLSYIMGLMLCSFWGIIKTGVPYLNCLRGVSTAISTSHRISWKKVSLLLIRTGYYLELNGLYDLALILCSCIPFTLSYIKHILKFLEKI